MDLAKRPFAIPSADATMLMMAESAVSLVTRVITARRHLISSTEDTGTELKTRLTRLLFLTVCP
jgi:hypothetical protein